MSPVDNREAMDALTRWITPLVKEAGFVRIAESEYYSRWIPDGKQSIGIAVWDYNPLVEVTITASIRLDEVEEVFHLFSGSLPEHRGFSHTVVTPFNYFSGGPPRVKAQAEVELAPVLANWEQSLHNEILPYFNFATNATSLDKLVNIDNEILDITLPPYSFMHHIILARIAKNDSYFDLVANHRSEMEDMNCNAELYDRLVEYLSVR
jgi:hypothetical protein